MMFRKIGLTVLLLFAFAALAGSASAAPITIKANLSGDPRPVEPDNIFVDVTVWWDPAVSAYDSYWTVDVNSPAHPDAKLGAFGFNMVGLGVDYTFSDFNPNLWGISPGTFLPGSGDMIFMFVANDPPGVLNDVTNSVNLTFTMTKSSIVGPLAVADFLGAPCSASNDVLLGCHQLGAHMQSLVGSPGGTDSGVAVGDFYQDLPRPPVPEPASMILFGTGLIAVGAIRRIRRKS